MDKGRYREELRALEESCKPIDEAIDRHSVKSEEVQEAIEHFEALIYIGADKYLESKYNLAIAALRAYQPRVEGKATDNINCCPNCGWRWRERYETEQMR